MLEYFRNWKSLKSIFRDFKKNYKILDISQNIWKLRDLKWFLRKNLIIWKLKTFRIIVLTHAWTQAMCYTWILACTQSTKSTSEDNVHRGWVTASTWMFSQKVRKDPHWHEQILNTKITDLPHPLQGKLCDQRNEV